MKKSPAKPTLSRRFFAWLVPIVASFIVKRIMKRMNATSKPVKKDRKYVKNKAD